MPNYCTNEVLVKGGRVLEVSAYISDEEGKCDFDFDKVIPYPDEYRIMDEESNNDAGFNSGGYDWCLKNWGTKWNSIEASVYIGSDSVTFNFDTAWSPSLPVTLELSKRFPSEVFVHTFEEGGMDFSGQVVMQAGKILSEVDGKYGDFRLSDDSCYMVDGGEDETED